MRQLREDYDAIQPFPTKRQHWVIIDGEKVLADNNIGSQHLGKHMDPIIPDDEPVFLLRAKSPADISAVKHWAHRLIEDGGDPELARRVIEWARVMDEYREEHYPFKKPADVPDGLLREVTG